MSATRGKAGAHVGHPRKRQGLQPASLSLRLSTLCNFMDWLVSIGQLLQTRREVFPCRGRHLPKNMDVDEVDHLLDIDTHDLQWLCYRAMLEVIYGGVLRLAEVVGLNCAGVDLSCGEVRVVGKGTKERKLSSVLPPWPG